MGSGVLLDLRNVSCGILAGADERPTRDWFLDTVEPAREVVRDKVSKWDIVVVVVVGRCGWKLVKTLSVGLAAGWRDGSGCDPRVTQ